MQTSGDVCRRRFVRLFTYAQDTSLKGVNIKRMQKSENECFTAHPHLQADPRHAPTYVSSRWRSDQLQCTACVVIRASVKQSALLIKVRSTLIVKEKKETAAVQGHIASSRRGRRHRGAALSCKWFTAGEAVCKLACLRHVLSAAIRAASKAGSKTFFRSRDKAVIWAEFWPAKRRQRYSSVRRRR